MTTTRVSMKGKEDEIIRLYTLERKTGYEIAKQFKCSDHAIYSILKKNLIKRRSYVEANRNIKLNTQYFNIINTEEKAYILGFLYADGCNTLQNRVKLSLHEKDKEILEKIKDCIGYKGTLKYLIKEKPRANQWSLLISSKEISEDLSKLGCVPRKSLVLKFPNEEQVPSHLLSHFIRGYFDGDGGISVGKVYSIHFVGTQEMLTGIMTTLDKELNITIKKLYNPKHTKGKNFYSLIINGRFQIKKILDFLYKDATIYLDRKYQRYQEFCKKQVST